MKKISKADISLEILKRASKLSDDTDLEFKEAIGQVIGELISEIDAKLRTNGERLDRHKNSPFVRELKNTLNQWIEDEK